MMAQLTDGIVEGDIPIDLAHVRTEDALKHEAIEEFAENLKQRAKIFRSVFSTPEGEQVLEYLAEELDRQFLRGTDPYDTYYNLGRRDALVYIKQMMEYQHER